MRADLQSGGQDWPTGRQSRLWLWVVAAFAAQGLAWTAWFIIAAHHPVQSVPVVRSP